MNKPVSKPMPAASFGAAAPVKFPAPNRVWEPTGRGGWSSREWRPGEKLKYEREVLGRG